MSEDRITQCPTCGSKVKVVGRTTMSYEPVPQLSEEIEKHSDTLTEVFQCASSWQPEVRLLGNVRADDMAAACKYAVLYMAQKAEYEQLLREVEDALEESKHPECIGDHVVFYCKCKRCVSLKKLKDRK